VSDDGGRLADVEKAVDRLSSTITLPVTVHFADQIAEFALKGIKPRTPQGTLPFWL
jgi:argonaute-like protein implicated in RNA metabolism and viral defense